MNEKGETRRTVEQINRTRSWFFERTQIQKLTLHLKELEKKQQIDPTPSRRRELIKI